MGDKNDNAPSGKGKPTGFKLMINRKQHEWPAPSITGTDIKQLAGSPVDYVVNQLVSGPGEDPEIADAQPVDLSGPGVEQFVTRKPKTTPGE